ncbi:hypothetical protein NQ318_009791 [Aromia moschata]|uniref:Prolactin regulatory element-binding protein n=1 Tax=Aromia moschata TaxID=1265417 RepID=A0AAV8Y933_9CUCU|nr:hypothetical protein NQ318_009791 [Aromia moschata]
MAPTRRNTEDILARVNFPLYTIQMLSNRHVIVGGGGGSSKTGVANGFRKLLVNETGGSVVMNCSTFCNSKHSYLVAGQESHCQLYNVNTVLVREEADVENIGNNHSEVRQRKPRAKEKTDNNENIKKKLKFVINPSDSVQTDFNGPEPLFRVARINHSGILLATGGTDGNPTKKEIDDIDFSRYDNYLITIAKDGAAVLWDCVRGKELKRLTWNQPEGSKYLYKRCRFGIIEGEDKKSILYMLANPTGVAKKQKAYLQQWLPEEGSLKRVAEFDESLAALAVRDDGRFIAVGTMFSGSVSLFVAFNLQRVLNIAGAHSMFVTGLEFLPALSENENHTVCSVAEGGCAVHFGGQPKTMPLWVGMVILIFTLFLTFVFCSYIGL